MKASMEVLEKHNTQNYGDINVIRQTLQLILNNNYFEFNGKYYLQTHGTAMGTPVAPSYANLFMAALEEQLLFILNSRGYKNNVINEAFNKALQYTQHDILHQEKLNNNTNIPLNLVFHTTQIRPTLDKS